MKIGINARFAAEPSSGVGGYTLQLLRALAELDNKNSYYLYTDVPLPLLKKLPNNFSVRHTALPKAGGRYFDVHFTESGQYTGDVPDILHIPHFKVPKRLSGARLVLTLHDIIPIVFLRPRYLFRGRSPVKMLSSMGLTASISEPFLLRRADRVITISEASRQDIARYLHYPEKKMTVIPNGVSPDFQPLRNKRKLEAVRERYRLEKPFCINFGGLVVRKNLKRQIDAFCEQAADELKDYEFIITGNGYWKARLEKQYPPDAPFRFLGRVPFDDLRALVSMADFSLYASLYEGFGFPVLESLACGTPVITSEGSSMRELIPRAVRHCNPWSKKSIARAIVDVQENLPEWQERVSQNQGQLEYYSWKRAAHEYLQVYQSLAD